MKRTNGESKDHKKTAQTKVVWLDRPVTLRDIRLVATTALNQIQGDDRPNHLRQTIRLKAKGHVETSDIVVIFTLRIGGLGRSGEEVLAIEAVLASVYHVDSLDGIADDDLLEFGRHDGLHHVWPYWREYVQSLTTRMSLPALRIPLIVPEELRLSSGEKIVETPEITGQTSVDPAPAKRAKPRRK